MLLNLTDRQAKILDALWAVESSRAPGSIFGDGGKARGPLQIWAAFWEDAAAFDPELGGTYHDCDDLFYACAVVQRYMLRYAGAAWHAGRAEIIARTHNGGPTGETKAATKPYWLKVRRELYRKWPEWDWDY